MYFPANPSKYQLVSCFVQENKAPTVRKGFRFLEQVQGRGFLYSTFVIVSALYPKLLELVGLTTIFRNRQILQIGCTRRKWPLCSFRSMLSTEQESALFSLGTAWRHTLS